MRLSVNIGWRYVIIFFVRMYYCTVSGAVYNWIYTKQLFLYYHWTKPFCQKPITTSVITERENKRWEATYQVFVLFDKHDERCTLGVCQLHHFCCHLGASLLLETTISSWHHALGTAFVSKQIHTQNNNVMHIKKHNFNMKQSGSSPC